MKQQAEPKYGDQTKCKHCGGILIWNRGGSSGSDMWLHRGDRWPNDNGYWCYKTSNIRRENTPATPIL